MDHEYPLAVRAKTNTTHDIQNTTIITYFGVAIRHRKAENGSVCSMRAYHARRRKAWPRWTLTHRTLHARWWRALVHLHSGSHSANLRTTRVSWRRAWHSRHGSSRSLSRSTGHRTPWSGHEAAWWHTTRTRRPHALWRHVGRRPLWSWTVLVITTSV